MKLFGRELLAKPKATAERSYSFGQWQLDTMNYGGITYPLGLQQTLPGKPQETIANDFCGYVRGAYKSNGIVFACVQTRAALFSQGRFQFRRLSNGKPQDFWGDQRLRVLERPWPGARTSDLLARMEQDNSLGGGAFVLDRGAAGLRRLRPDWVTIVIASNVEDSRYIGQDPDAEVAGYAYTLGGPQSGNPAEVYPPELVAHYFTTPDPEKNWRGMSWLTPVVIEVMGDKAASEHKLAFFEQGGGTPNMIVEFDPEKVDSMEKMRIWAEGIDEQVASFGAAKRRLYLGGGTKTTVVGSNFQEIEFKATQGAGETRIALAAGVPAVVLGISEGLQGSSLNTGNYAAAMRRFSELTMEHLWLSAADALDTLIAVPSDSELAVDTRNIPALQADRTDAAQIQTQRMETITGYVREGFEPDSAVAATVNDDETLLTHTGLTSVQVQPPAGTNGSGDAAAVPTASAGG